jgi:hypothetical protein
MQKTSSPESGEISVGEATFTAAARSQIRLKTLLVTMERTLKATTSDPDAGVLIDKF